MKGHLLLLAKTWGWSKDDGLSTVIKEMAMQFAKNKEVQVSCLVTHISKDLQAQAEEFDVHLFGSRCLNGLSTLNGLFVPPKSVVDVNATIGYGKVVGPNVQLLKVLYVKSKWIHIACSSSETQDKDEIQFCEGSDLTFAIGNDVAKE